MVNNKLINIPIRFIKGSRFLFEPITVLAGDVGGTKTNLALYEFKGDTLDIIQKEQFHSGSFTDLISLLQQFLKGRHQPGKISLGVAGPVLNGRAKITNLSWQIDKDVIRDITGVEDVSLINDMEATAYGLEGLHATELSIIQKGDPDVKGNIGIIAPGTGLGEAGLYWDGQFYNPFATEGGHTAFSPSGKEDIPLYNYLEKQFGHVSWERLISGPGIFNIYCFLRDIKKMTTPVWLVEKLRHGNEAAVISQYASHTQCAICAEVMKMFFRFTAEECADLALKLKATGGIFIGGGIVPQTRYLLDKEEFIQHFLQAGRMKELLKKIPVKIILNDRTALNGAAYYSAYS